MCKFSRTAKQDSNSNVEQTNRGISMVKLNTAISIVLVIMFFYIESILTIVCRNNYFEYIFLSTFNFFVFFILFGMYTSGKD